MAKKRIDRTVDVDKASVVFEVLSGPDKGNKITCGVDTIGLQVDTFKKLPPMTQRCILHGLNAKVGDSAADPTEVASDVMKDVMQQLKSGQWASRTAGSGPRTTILIEALKVLTKQTDEAIEKRLDSMSDEEVKALKAQPNVASEMKSIEAKRAVERAAEAKKAAEGSKFTF